MSDIPTKGKSIGKRPTERYRERSVTEPYGEEMPLPKSVEKSGALPESAGKRPVVEVLFTGSELLEGRPNTHQNYLALGLKNAGLSLTRATTVPDDEGVIAQAIRESFSRAEALIVCGGLGPTFDDLTREAAARALNRKLRYHPDIFNQIRARFSRLRLRLPEENRRQAYVLDGARIIENPRGSAPGQILEIERENQFPQILALLPGPFAEMSPLFEEIVLPKLRSRYARGRYARHWTVHLSGISESLADEKLSSVTRLAGENASFTILGLAGQVDYHASAWGRLPAEVDKRLELIKKKTLRAVGPFIFGEDSDALESVLGRELRRKGQTLAAAESCTAGGFSARLTSVPGSSDYFLGAALTYSNESKTRLLGVSRKTIARFGAVSSACAREMAEGAKKIIGASLGASITGIAGPGGGSAEKPVGLVFVGLAGFSKTPVVHELRLSGDRETIRKGAVAGALHFALKELKKM